MGVPDKCPKCGCSLLESHERPIGRMTAIFNLENGEVDCSILYDSLRSSFKWLYCNDCGHRVCTVEAFNQKFADTERGA